MHVYKYSWSHARALLSFHSPVAEPLNSNMLNEDIYIYMF